MDGVDSLLPAKQALISLVTFHVLRLVLKTCQERIRSRIQSRLPNLKKQSDAFKATSTLLMEKGKPNDESQPRERKKKNLPPAFTLCDL